MSVTVRTLWNGKLEVDIRVVLPDGRLVRERRLSPAPTKSLSQRWAEQRERWLVKNGKPAVEREMEVTKITTLREFAPKFVDGYARANQQKPSGIAAKETILSRHLVPLLGDKPLNEIRNEDVQQLKARLIGKAPKTVNNILSVLNTLLRVAIEWRVIDEMPCAIKLVRTAKRAMAFHDFEDFERLVQGAEEFDHQSLVIVLLGGEAGLRCGEMMALEWRDVKNGHVAVERSEWKGKVTTTKGNKVRYVRMSKRLAAALEAHRHLRSPRILCDDEGEPLTQKMVQVAVRNVARRAGLQNCGVHTLRHTFCSRLAMRGAPAKSIQELAGHQDLTTTLRYMHVSPAALDDAITLLETPEHLPSRGANREAAGTGAESARTY